MANYGITDGKLMQASDMVTAWLTMYTTGGGGGKVKANEFMSSASDYPTARVNITSCMAVASF